MSNAIPEAVLGFIDVGEGPSARRIAVRSRAGRRPGLVWLGGFKSDMRGSKAVALDAWAADHGRAAVRFDYSGHGESGGDFADGTIGSWLEDSVAVFERFCDGPQVLIGSSMGGWMALLLAREIRKRASKASLAGLVLIAPAPDFTEELMWKIFGRGEEGNRNQRLLAAAVGLWRWLALSDHAESDRGGPQSFGARQRHRSRLSRPHPPGRAGSGCALAARLRADASPAGRRRRADHDPGWRSPPLPSAGHRPHSCRGGRDRVRVAAQHSVSSPDLIERSSIPEAIVL
ncbi:alpha/beta hydrolase [Bradyrhizobium japonicum]